MRILHVIPAIAPRYGGASQSILGMCRALQNEGAEVLIATTDADGPHRLPVKLAEPVFYQGVPVIFFSRQWSEGLKYSRPLECWLEKHVKDFDLVEIHAVFSHSSLAAGGACQRHQIPYVMHPIGSLDPWCLAQKSLRKRLLWLMVARKLLRNAAAIHYTTTEEKERAEQSLGLNHGIVIPLGVNEELLESEVEPEIFRRRFPSLKDSPYLITLCRLHSQKGLELLIEAFLDSSENRTLQDWRLVITGEGPAPYVRHLKRFVQKKGGEEKIVFTGWLEGKAKTAALREASLFVSTSYQESFGLSIVEAMACRIPVLVSRNVNLSHEIEETGAGWVSELESGALRNSLLMALGSETERCKRGSRGLELVKRRFRWAMVGKALIHFYREMMTQRRNSR